MILNDVIKQTSLLNYQQKIIRDEVQQHLNDTVDTKLQRVIIDKLYYSDIDMSLVATVANKLHNYLGR
jgi:hypothetical protein